MALSDNELNLRYHVAVQNIRWKERVARRKEGVDEGASLDFALPPTFMIRSRGKGAVKSIAYR